MPARYENEIKIDSTTDTKLKELPSYVNEWHTKLKASSKTASARYDMVCKINKFLSSIDEDVMNVTPEMITDENVTSYYTSVATKVNKKGKVVPTSDSYKQGVYSALKNFLGFMSSKGYIEDNYILSIDRPSNHDLDRINEHRIKMTKDTFKAVIREVKKERKDILRCRDEALLRVFMGTGMRETALMILNVSDIDFKKKKLQTIDKGHGGKNQVYYLDDNTLVALYNWIKLRDKMYGDSLDALFVSQHNQRISIKGIYKIVDKYFYRAIGKHVSPHKIRAGVASILYEQTGNIEYVRRALGQAKTETTQRYIVTDNSERRSAAQLLKL